jgi:hypothetical protein
MATYQIQINERTSLGKSIVALLNSVPQAVTVKKQKKKRNPDLIYMTVSTVPLPMSA